MTGVRFISSQFGGCVGSLRGSAAAWMARLHDPAVGSSHPPKERSFVPSLIRSTDVRGVGARVTLIGRHGKGIETETGAG
jgi:hypothetical protein